MSTPSTSGSGRSSFDPITAQLCAAGELFEMEEVVVLDERHVRVWKNCPRSLRDVLELSKAHGDKTFLVYEDERTSFAQHFQLCSAAARYLIDELGLTKADRVAIAMRNLPEWSIAFWASAAAGGIVVPLNAWWKGSELSYGLSDSGAKIAFVDTERLELLRPHLDELPALEALIVTDEDRRPIQAQRIAAVSVIGFSDVVSRAASGGGDLSLPDVAIDPDDDATIFYTSGTTGEPKGAVGTHRNICTNLMSLFFLNTRASLARKLAADAEEKPGDDAEETQSAYLLSVPLFHATGCHSILVGNTAAGAKLVMMHHWDPERALELIERERITTVGGVPAVVMSLIDHPSFASRDTSSVKSVAYGGAPAPPDLVRRIREHFPSGSPANGYGLTETSSITTMNMGDDYVRKPDSVGPPVPVCDVVVVPEGHEPPPGQAPRPNAPQDPGEVGELWINGPNVVRGYWNKPEATAASFVRGWLRTGDISSIDEEGFVHVVDRAKDMVIRGGENVSSVEVEDVLFEHPAVADAAVIGVPHPVLGEEVGAVIVLRPGARVEGDELARHVRERLAAFKVPAHFWFRSDPLPRSPQGKVLKRDLRRQLAGGD